MIGWLGVIGLMFATAIVFTILGYCLGAIMATGGHEDDCVEREARQMGVEYPEPEERWVRVKA